MDIVIKIYLTLIAVFNFNLDLIFQDFLPDFNIETIFNQIKLIGDLIHYKSII